VVPGTILRDAWRLYAAHWRHLVPIAFLVYAFVTAVAVVLAFLIGAFALFVTLAGVFWLQGVLVQAVEDVRDGRADLSIRETIERVAPRANVLSVTAILAAFGIGLGLVLVVVPGLVLLTWWSVIVPAIVLERAGVFRSFRRSRELVRGNAWNVFAVIVMTFAVLFVGQLLVALLAAPIDPGWLEVIVASVVSNALFAPFAAVAWTLTYFRLRELETVPAG